MFHLGIAVIIHSVSSARPYIMWCDDCFQSPLKSLCNSFMIILWRSPSPRSYIPSGLLPHYLWYNFRHELCTLERIRHTFYLVHIPFPHRIDNSVLKFFSICNGVFTITIFTPLQHSLHHIFTPLQHSCFSSDLLFP